MIVLDKFIYNIYNVSLVSAQKLKCPSSARLGSEPFQLSSGNFSSNSSLLTMYFTGTLLALAKSVDEISAANCQIPQLQSTMPDYLVFDSTPENDTITPGIESILKCNSTLLFLEPDVIGNNTLNLACGEDGNFVFPDPWPLCVIKCEVSQISAELEYAPIDGRP